MNLVILGKPGAGKGSLCKEFTEKENITHLSTGDLFRREIAAKTSLGVLADSYISKGNLVPDEVTNKIVENILIKNPNNSYLFDGYPRTVNQAEFLDDAMAKLGIKLDAVIDMKVEDDLVIKRLTARRVCKDCGEIYNLNNHMPKIENTCDSCGGMLITREDDKLESITSRLSVYERQTKPLIDYYTKKNVLVEVDGTLDPDEVYACFKQGSSSNK